MLALVQRGLPSETGWITRQGQEKLLVSAGFSAVAKIEYQEPLHLGS